MGPPAKPPPQHCNTGSLVSSTPRDTPNHTQEIEWSESNGREVGADDDSSFFVFLPEDTGNGARLALTGTGDHEEGEVEMDPVGDSGEGDSGYSVIEEQEAASATLPRCEQEEQEVLDWAESKHD